MNMKFLVTGAAGFIGFHVSGRLLDAGHQVVGIDNLNDYYDVSLKEARLNLLTSENFTFHKLDLADREGMAALFANEKFDRVIHLAAQAGVRYSLENPHAYADANLIGHLNVLEGCRHNQVQHLLYASSSSVYGLNRKMPFSTDDSVDHPVSLYAATKKANELMSHTYSHLYNLPTTGLRFFTVYGPWGRPDMAVFRLLASSRLQEKFRLTASTEVIRDFTYVNDVSDVIGTSLRLDTDQLTPEIYNVAGGSPFTLAKLFEILDDLGISTKIEQAPIDALDVKVTHGSVVKLEESKLPVPSTSLRAGIQETWSWMNQIEIEQLRAWFEYNH
jgi:UDP-glucuronate 4-epimerase